jgi:hypothetical protein
VHDRAPRNSDRATRTNRTAADQGTADTRRASDREQLQRTKGGRSFGGRHASRAFMPTRAIPGIGGAAIALAVIVGIGLLNRPTTPSHFGAVAASSAQPPPVETAAASASAVSASVEPSPVETAATSASDGPSPVETATVPASPEPSPIDSNAPILPTAVGGRAWTAEIQSGVWAAGSVGGPTIDLPSGEVPVAAADGWVLSAFKNTSGDNLAWRRDADSKSTQMPVSFIAASAVIFGDDAYLAGYDRSTGGDPGVFKLDLASGSLNVLLPSSGMKTPRSVVISRTGKTLASATCSTDGACDLDVLDLQSGTAAHIKGVGGYLRSTGDAVAVVGPDPATWFAAIDLQTGKELWRHEADEVWSGYVTSTGSLVQAYLTYSDKGSDFAVDKIDVATGSASTVFTRKVTAPIGLWAELSSDDTIVIGPGYSIDDALANSVGKAVVAETYLLAGRAVVSTQLQIGGN